MTRTTAMASRTMNHVHASAVARPPLLAVAPPLRPQRQPLRLAPQRARRIPHLARLVSHPQVALRAARARRHTRVHSQCLRSPARRPHSRSQGAASRCQASLSSIPHVRASSSLADSRHRPTIRTLRPLRTARPLRRATQACTGHRQRDMRGTPHPRRTGLRGMIQARVVQGKVPRACRLATRGVRRLCSRTTTMRNGDEEAATRGVADTQERSNLERTAWRTLAIRASVLVLRQR